MNNVDILITKRRLTQKWPVYILGEKSIFPLRWQFWNLSVLYKASEELLRMFNPSTDFI
jgi:hypothetical protein